MKRERFIILLGILIALVFFYLGLNEWLKMKDQNAQPPPLIVKPLPQKKEEAQNQPSTEPVETKEEATQQKPEEKQPTKDKEQDVIAKKIREERNVQSIETKAEAKTSERRESSTSKPKTYTVQVGAFKSKESAERAAEKAKKMGYKVNIVEEDDFYKVRLSVNTENIESELRKLRTAFGSAILKR